jgi:hypothetical protein
MLCIYPNKKEKIPIVSITMYYIQLKEIAFAGAMGNRVERSAATAAQPDAGYVV